MCSAYGACHPAPQSHTYSHSALPVPLRIIIQASSVLPPPLLPFIHSIIHSFSHSFIHSLIRSFFLHFTPRAESTQVDQGLDVLDLVPDDSYARQYISTARSYGMFEYDDSQPLELAFVGVDVADVKVQADMVALQADVSTVVVLQWTRMHHGIGKNCLEPDTSVYGGCFLTLASLVLRRTSWYTIHLKQVLALVTAQVLYVCRWGNCCCYDRLSLCRD